MKKFDGLNTVNGVFSRDFQLSDVPIFGEWKIAAAIGDQVCVYRYFMSLDGLAAVYWLFSLTGQNGCRGSCRIFTAKA